jgi:hypothetical protein
MQAPSIEPKVIADHQQHPAGSSVGSGFSRTF